MSILEYRSSSNIISYENDGGSSEIGVTQKNNAKKILGFSLIKFTVIYVFKNTHYNNSSFINSIGMK